MEAHGTTLNCVILTCSYGPDRDYFRILCESIDRHAPAFKHIGLVPRRDLKLFKHFAGPRREIMAQEDFLPRGVWNMPMPPVPLRRFLRLPQRDQFFTRSGLRASGWVMQQLIKFRLCTELEVDVIVNIDSDAALIRDFQIEDHCQGTKVRLFREPCTINPDALWRRSATSLLNLREKAPKDPLNYVTLPTFWRRPVMQGMLDHLEAVHGAPWHEPLIRTKHISDDNLYGHYWNFVYTKDDAHFATDRQLMTIKAFTDGAPLQVNLRGFVDTLQPSHLLACVQSTIRHSAEERRAFIDALRDVAQEGPHAAAVSGEGAERAEVSAPHTGLAAQ